MASKLCRRSTIFYNTLDPVFFLSWSFFALAKNMSHKASLTSKTESGPTWSNQPSTNWHKRGTTALEELAMQNKKSLQIKQISRTKYFLPTSLISLTMLTSILYQHLTMQMRRDVSTRVYHHVILS